MEKFSYDKALIFVESILGDDKSGHSTDHAIRVYKLAVEIAAGEVDVDAEAIALTALLHDVDDHKISPETYENKDNARRFLASCGYAREYIDYICGLIDGISWSKNKDAQVEDVNLACVQDADRLDAIGAIGIMRAFAFVGSHGQSFDDGIRHFYEKLLLVSSRLNTNTARKIAEQRDAVMKDFLRAYYVEQKLEMPTISL